MEGERGGLRQVYITPRSKVVAVVLRTDASTTGMAGILVDQQGRPLEYRADPICDAGWRWFRAEAGIQGSCLISSFSRLWCLS